MALALLQELWDFECFPHIEHYSVPGRILFKFCWVVIVYHAATQLWFETHLLWLWKTTKCSSIHILRKWIIKRALHSFWLFNQEFNDFRRNSAVQHFLRIVHCVYFHCCWGSNWFVLYYMVINSFWDAAFIPHFCFKNLWFHSNWFSLHWKFLSFF